MRCLLFFLVLGLVHCKNQGPGLKSDEPILVGEFASLTGSESTFGLSTHKGILLAIDEANAQGGVKGRPLKLITEDNKSKVELVAPTVEKLIKTDEVLALIGEVASQRSLAAAPIAQRHGIPMISPSSTNPAVTRVGNYIFRVCFIDPFQGYVMAKFAIENLKIKRVVIFKDKDSKYSLGLADYFERTFRRLGGQILGDFSYASGDVDFKDELLKIKTLKPEALFLPGYYNEVALIARQSKQIGIKAQFLGGDGWDSPKLYEVAQDAINGAYFSNHFTEESRDPEVVKFIENFRKKFDSRPDGLAAGGYDAAWILIDAMKRTANLKPDEIRKELANTKNYVGPTGKITINRYRNADKPAVVVRIEGTTHRYVTTISP